LQRAECRTDLATLRSAQMMLLSGHPVTEWNHLWLLTHIEHQGSQDPVVAYSNRIRAMHWAVPFESPHSAQRPRMHSLQRAWVVDVDEAQPDPSRPVAVQFDWLYQGEGARPSHCWLPLAPQLEAANVERLSEGAEVVVSFVEGDPDRPLITGILHLPARVEDSDASVAINDDYPPVGVQGWLRSGEPLMLLCLLPGGGSFNHCVQALCTCRAAIQLGKSGAA
jgi:type VI secretion system secreted protein VgrG